MSDQQSAMDDVFIQHDAGEIRILIVDDHERWRQRLRSILQPREKLRVVAEAVNGLEAVQKAQDLKPDLILLDIALPKLNGIEAAKHIRQVAPATKIIFVSQMSDEEVVQAALSTGAQAYVWKINAPNELLTAVAEVVAGRTFVSRGTEPGNSGESLSANES